MVKETSTNFKTDRQTRVTFSTAAATAGPSKYY